MSGRSYILLTAALLGCGCASTPPINATWFLVNRAGADPEIFIAILNQSSNTLLISEIELNPINKPPKFGFIFSPKQTFSWFKNKEIELEPGGVFYQPVAEFKRDEKGVTNSMFPPCHVPVSVRLTVGSEKSKTIIPVGGVPSAAPEPWEKGCPPAGLESWRSPAK